MSLIPKGSPVHVKQAKISGVKADFANKLVTVTLKIPFSVNPDILQVATDDLAFISFADLPVSVEIQQLQQVMDFNTEGVTLTRKGK